MTPAFFAPLRAFQASSNPQDVKSNTSQCGTSNCVPNHTFRMQASQSLAETPKLQSHSLFNLSTKPVPAASGRSSLDLKLGMKRLHSSACNPDGSSKVVQQDHQRDSGQSYSDENHNESDLCPRFEKRHRTSDWPLKGLPNKDDVSVRAPLRNRSRGNGSSTNSHSPNSPRLRPSRFLEGSMNDRISMKPHSSYIGADEEVESRYETDQVEPGGQMQRHLRSVTHHSNPSLASGSLVENSGTSRHSGIFKFGKSLSAAFNPSNWKIWSTKSQESEHSNHVDKIIRSRQEMDEQAYGDIKLKDEFQEFSNASAFKFVDASRGTAQHNSSVIFSQRATGSGVARARNRLDMMGQEKRQGVVLLEQGGIFIAGRSDSPASEERISPSRASFHSKKPSLQNLRFANSFQQEGPSRNNTQNLDTSHLPSRKDLRKQQNLVKKVSDLEGKLEAARRQLAEALKEPIPDGSRTNSRPRFKGYLATLPSERCLLGLDTSTEDNEDIRKAVAEGNHLKLSLDEEMKPYQSASSEPKSPPRSPSSTLAGEQQLNILLSIEQPLGDYSETTGIGAYRESAAVGEAPESTDALRVKQTSKKRKNIGLSKADDGGKYKPFVESDDDDEKRFEARTKPRSSKQKIPRGRKLLKTFASPYVSETVTSAKTTAAIDLDHTVDVKREAHTMNKIPKIGSQPSSPPPPSVKKIPMGTSTYKNAMHGNKKEQGETFNRYLIESEVPPVPSIPTAVNLASEVIVKIPGGAIPTLSSIFHTENAGRSMKSTNSGGEMKIESLDAATKAQGVLLKRDESFEWPEDIF